MLRNRCVFLLLSLLTLMFSPLMDYSNEPGPYAIFTGLFGVLIINLGPFLLIMAGLWMLLTLRRLPAGAPGKTKFMATGFVFLFVAALALGFRVLILYVPYLALAYDKVYMTVYYGFPVLLVVPAYFVLALRNKTKTTNMGASTAKQEAESRNNKRKAVSTPFLWIVCIGLGLIVCALWYRFERHQNEVIQEQYNRDHPSVAILNQQAAIELSQMRRDLERYRNTGKLPEAEGKRSNAPASEKATRGQAEKGGGMVNYKTDVTSNNRPLSPDNELAREAENEVSGLRDQEKINDLAKKEFHAKNYRKAAAIWAWLISKYPAQGKFYINMAMTLHNLDNIDRAKEHVLKGVSLMPQNGWALFNCGIILLAKEDYLGALRAYKQAIAKGYDNTDSRYGLACALGAYYWQCTEKDRQDPRSKEMKKLRWEAIKEFRKLHDSDRNSFSGHEEDIRKYSIILKESLDKPVWLMYLGL